MSHTTRCPICDELFDLFVSDGAQAIVDTKAVLLEVVHDHGYYGDRDAAWRASVYVKGELKKKRGAAPELREHQRKSVLADLLKTRREAKQTTKFANPFSPQHAEAHRRATT